MWRWREIGVGGDLWGRTSLFIQILRNNHTMIDLYDTIPDSEVALIIFKKRMSLKRKYKNLEDINKIVLEWDIKLAFSEDEINEKLNKTQYDNANARQKELLNSYRNLNSEIESLENYLYLRLSQIHGSGSNEV